MLVIYLLVPTMNNQPAAVMYVALREVSTFVCIILCYMCVPCSAPNKFSVFALQSDRQENRNPVGGVLHSFLSMKQLGLEWKYLKNIHCLLQLSPKPCFSIRVNISLHIAFCTCSNNSSKKPANIDSSVTGPGCYVFCSHCGLTFENVKGNECIFTKHFEYNPDCIHLLQSDQKYVIDKSDFKSLL